MKTIQLPAPAAAAGLDVAAALRLRRSTREYDLERTVANETLSMVLWAACGVTGPEDKRTAPSAFGRNQVRVSVAREDGVWAYDAAAHSLIGVDDRDARAGFSDDGWVNTAPVVVVLTARVDEYPDFIPAAMRLELSHATAGCIAENLHLICTALGLGTCMVGSIHADALRQALVLSNDEAPLYVMPIGYLRG
jgi:SagB-type dehydrogenase family enzyme